jgi:hypothetical protein
MIVTRRRRKPFPWKMIGIPVLAIVAIVAALSWPPSRAWIANAAWSGPAGPAVRAMSDARIRQLQAQQTVHEKDKQMADLQTQVGQLQTELDDAQNASAAKAAPTRAAPLQRPRARGI